MAGAKEGRHCAPSPPCPRPCARTPGRGEDVPGAAHKPRGAEAPARGCICARVAGAAGATAGAGAETRVRALRRQPHPSVRKKPDRLLCPARHLRLGLPAAAPLPLTFQPPLPARDAIPDPLSRERPPQPMGVPGAPAVTNCHGAALLESTAPPRDPLSARRDRAAVQGLGRAVGHYFIRSPGTGARGQRHFPTEEHPITARGLGISSLQSSLF